MNLLPLVALAAAQSAGPPPPEIAVVVAGAGMTDFAGDTLARVAPEDGSGMFRRTPPAFEVADFEACAGTGVEPEACVREILAARGAASLEGPPTVVVWVGPGPGFLTGWTCVGVGAQPTASGRQRTGLDWSPGQEAANADKAAGCVLAAAAESGW
ncbi:hypothetical protein [Brevundimonas viscosa]|uniref:Uncharacterized protein n=1 Tax=Brevundimonas viscosa TaxID=871741 RepID=A0A1I6P877_9CAUL|nr:hypothetical protein [Brevundimonas viscosa]SFS36389.1 hypothetical protein SAMN05192570_0921 [Brevundimonas viscosa]